MQYYSARSRSALKRYLWGKRSTCSPGATLSPQCPICNRPIVKAADLHEALLTRHDCEGMFQDMVYHPCNVVLRHHVCPDGKQSHTAGHGGQETFEKCARHIVEWEGYEAVERWLVEMSLLFPSAGKNALQRFVAISFSWQEKRNARGPEKF